ncbi:hypothetical protein [Thalassotalea ganghwensis]
MVAVPLPATTTFSLVDESLFPNLPIESNSAHITSAQRRDS